jgi:IS1 family transposase
MHYGHIESSGRTAMNQLSNEDRDKVVACLVEGNSIRATVRLTRIAKNTIVKLLVELDAACAEYQCEVFRDLPCKRLQVDEIWSFCYCKDNNVPKAMKGQFGYGDVWTFTAICADTKLVPCWRVGQRDGENAKEFMADVAARLSTRVQLTTDGHKMYLEAVDSAFGDEIDFAQLIKFYGPEPDPEKRYSPAQCIGEEKKKINGKPDMKQVSTSYVERQNLSMRMGIRRFNRLTNAFSKKVQNHETAIALFYMYYNFIRVHQILRVTPAMVAGITDRLWEISDIVALLEKSSN